MIALYAQHIYHAIISFARSMIACASSLYVLFMKPINLSIQFHFPYRIMNAVGIFFVML